MSPMTEALLIFVIIPVVLPTLLFIAVHIVQNRSN
jgi:hypothetical protein